MHVIQMRDEKLSIEISQEELLILNAAMNEICNGIDVFEFETRIGADRDRVALLLNEIRGCVDSFR